MRSLSSTTILATLLLTISKSSSSPSSSSSGDESSYRDSSRHHSAADFIEDFETVEETVGETVLDFMDEVKERYLSGSSSQDLLLYAGDTQYVGWQQAWRFLGFFVDCSGGRVYEENSEDHHGRDLSKSNEWDRGNGYCQRYLMWAAYLDPNYEGNGHGEYAYWNMAKSKWDETVCEELGQTYSDNNNGTSSCREYMDCHVPNTNWKLMGVYKEAFYASEWFEQLFKHQGYCLWDNEDVYEWMQTYYSSWPEGCVNTGYVSDEGNGIYIDLMPSSGGYMRTDLYQDNSCRERLPGNHSALLNTIRSKKGYLYGADLQKWNYYMDYYKVCQPCRTFNINNNRRQRDRDLGNGDDDYDPNDGNFACYDDAGYTNVNQCMKFRTHSVLKVATLSDLQAATVQGGIVKFQMGDALYGIPEWSTKDLESSIPRASEAATLRFMGAGFLVFAVGITSLISVLCIRRRRITQAADNLKEPLVDSNDKHNEPYDAPVNNDDDYDDSNSQSTDDRSLPVSASNASGHNGQTF